MSYSPFADDYLDMMPGLVTIEPFLGTTDAYSTPSYGPAQQYHCFINAVGEVIRSIEGQLIRTAASIYAHPKATDGTVLTALNEDARITLPDGRQPVLLRVDGQSDEVGLVAWVLFT